MSAWVSRVLTTVGFVVLCHAAYSANQYKNLAMLSGFHATYPPLDVVVEVVAALAVIVVGQVLPVKFEPVALTADNVSRSQAEQLGRPEMMTFNHRGRDFYKRCKSATKAAK
jgi:hypothetical protein